MDEIILPVRIPGLSLQSSGEAHVASERQALNLLLAHENPRLATVALQLPETAIPLRLECLATEMTAEDVLKLLRAAPEEITIERWSNDPDRFDGPVRREDVKPAGHYMWRWQARSTRGVVSVHGFIAAELLKRGAHSAGANRR